MDYSHIIKKYKSYDSHNNNNINIYVHKYLIPFTNKNIYNLLCYHFNNYNIDPLLRLINFIMLDSFYPFIISTKIIELTSIINTNFMIKIKYRLWMLAEYKLKFIILCNLHSIEWVNGYLDQYEIRNLEYDDFIDIKNINSVRKYFYNKLF